MAVKQGRYRGLTADERAAARRTRLLEATLEVWGAPDGPPVTMTRVCQAAGLTERYFYEQFAHLDEALVAVLQQVTDEIRDAAAAAIEATDGGPTERVRAAVAAYVQVITDDPRRGRITMLHAPSRAELRPHRERMLRGIAEYAAAEALELYGDEALTGPDALLAGMLFVGGLAETVSAWLDGTLDTDPDRIVEAATRAFTRLAHR